MNIFIQRVGDVPSSVYQQLRDLNYRENGLMRYCLSEGRSSTKPSDRAYNYTAVYGMVGTVVVSWALLMPRIHDTYVRALAKVYENARLDTVRKEACVVDTYFWTRMRYRRKGYGKKIAQASQQAIASMGGKVCKVHPHDIKSRSFMNAALSHNNMQVME